MEDRKFIDIPYIVKRQIEILKKQIKFDLITIHLAGGTDVLDLLDPSIGVFLVSDMSSNHSVTIDYSAEILQKRFLNLVGIVTQKDKNLQKLFRLVPGINNTIITDNQGQTYRKKIEGKNVIIVVGRGIYQHDNPVEAVKSYLPKSNSK